MKAEKANALRIKLAQLVTNGTDDFAECVLLTSIFLTDLIMSGTEEDADKARAMIVNIIIPTLNKAIDEREQFLKDNKNPKFSVTIRRDN